jgi:hypothetical protein
MPFEARSGIHYDDEYGVAGELIDLVNARPTWHRLAACQNHPEINWFPEVGESTAPAKTVCETCPVRRPCLGYALAADERFGIWGGTSPKERRKVRALLADELDGLAG